MLQIAEWLEATAMSTWVHESLWGFPSVVAVHILALTFSVGTVVWFDLRLLGVSMVGVPISKLYRQLWPWLLGGFALMFISGGILLAAYATAALSNVYFRIKAVALLAAGINAIVYHRVTERQIHRWDEEKYPARPARAAGLVSILVWAVVIVAGRMMSYTMF